MRTTPSQAKEWVPSDRYRVHPGFDDEVEKYDVDVVIEDTKTGILGEFDCRDVEVLECSGSELVPPLVLGRSGAGVAPKRLDDMTELDLRLAVLANKLPLYETLVSPRSKD